MKYGSKRNWTLFAAGLYLAAYGYGCLLVEPSTHLSSDMRGLGIGIICATVLFPVVFIATILPSAVYAFVTKQWSAFLGALFGALLALPLVLLNPIVTIAVDEITKRDDLSQGAIAIILGILCIFTTVALKPRKEKNSNKVQEDIVATAPHPQS